MNANTWRLVLVGAVVTNGVQVPVETWLAASGVTADYQALCAATEKDREPLVYPPEMTAYGKGVSAITELAMEKISSLPPILYIPRGHWAERLVARIEGMAGFIVVRGA